MSAASKTSQLLVKVACLSFLVTKRLSVFAVAIVFLLPSAGFAQIVSSFRISKSLQNELINITALSDSLNQKLADEKVYIRFDKSYYSVGDTIWLKGYLFNSTYLTPSEKSAIVNVEIANDSNKVVKKCRLAVHEGAFIGSMGLKEDEFSQGTYIIRAYTNWMRNKGEVCFFYKRFYVSSGGENNWLVDSKLNSSVANDKNSVSAQLLFADMNRVPFAVKPLTLQVKDNNRNLYRQKLQTGVDGVLDINFNIPGKTTGIEIIAESEQKDKRAVIPVILNRPEKTDVQFLPEGGNLMAGLPAHIGFKAIAEDGSGVNISGIIVDHEQKLVTKFMTTHNGIGNCDITPKPGEVYTAKVTLPAGMVKEYQLPVVKNSGTVLQVTNGVESDFVEVTVSAAGDAVNSGNIYFLIGKARGIVCYAATLNFQDKNYVKRKVVKSLFPTGIAHFTLMAANREPLNERLIFINHDDNLHIRISVDKPVYNTRDSVSLRLSVTDNMGKPVAGNFSVAVTDDAQVKTDTTNNENILSHFLLTSDLKGYVETPGYYFSARSAETRAALDNLLLTQGWIGYSWPQLFNKPKLPFEAEQEFKVSGWVNNVFNNPVKGTRVVLLSLKPSILKDTLTDKAGRFAFHNFPQVDTPVFIIKAVNKSGKSFNVNVNIDETTAPVFSKPLYPALLPWYLNSDTTLLNYTRNNALAKQLQYFPESGHILKEVKISAKKIIKDSQNVNGPGNADQVVDQETLEKAGKKTIFDLLEEKVTGFKIKTIFDHTFYAVNDQEIEIIIDGTKLTSVIPIAGFNDLRRYLQSHSAEDIKGIEVSSSGTYTSKYNAVFNYSITSLIAFIEITTRSGHGPVIDNTIGMYLYKPTPISEAAQFYKPKYDMHDSGKQIPDLRSTITWEPTITTDEKGEATVAFYSAGKASKYTVIVEGSDLNGNLGYVAGRINVK